MSNYTMHILVCGGTGCISAKSNEIITNFEKALEKVGMTDQVQVLATGCFGFCEKGPIVKFLPDSTFYVEVTPEDVEELVNEHVIKGRVVERLLYIDPNLEKTIEDSKHMDFYKKQMRVALRNCGFVDPHNIEEYIARDGYQALGKALLEMDRLSVIK